MPESEIRIRVEAGKRQVETGYVTYVTTAPREFDGFGTLTIYQSGDERYVLINREHLDWQLGRYGSGLYVATGKERLEGFVFDRIWKAIPLGLNSLLKKDE